MSPRCLLADHSFLTFSAESSTQAQVFSKFPALGFHVFSFDQVGHGRSCPPAELGQVPDWHLLVDAALTCLEHIYSTPKFSFIHNLPFFIAGHSPSSSLGPSIDSLGSSMGGAVSIHLSLRLQEFIAYPYSYPGDKGHVSFFSLSTTSVCFDPYPGSWSI